MNNNRILKLSVNDVLFDYRQASDTVTMACNHKIPMTVTGCVKTGETLLLTLEEVLEQQELEYIFAPFPSQSEAAIEAEINTRFFSGFSTISGFEIKDDLWGLFVLDRSKIKS